MMEKWKLTRFPVKCQLFTRLNNLLESCRGVFPTDFCCSIIEGPNSTYFKHTGIYRIEYKIGFHFSFDLPISDNFRMEFLSFRSLWMVLYGDTKFHILHSALPKYLKCCLHVACCLWGVTIK